MPTVLRLFAVFLVASSTYAGGVACVMAKYNGETLDYALVYGKSHPVEAQEEAKAALRAKGYGDYLKHLDVIRAQNLSDLDHGHVVVIRSEFEDIRGKPRSAMGCGFARGSFDDAEWDAVRDLQAYFWGWKPDQHGYRVLERFRF
jgi:hypothetical protein